MMIRKLSHSWKSYIVPLEYTYSVILHLILFIVLIRSMKTRRNVSRRLEDEITNAGDPPYGDQVPPLEENANVYQALDNPPPMTRAQMKAILAQMAQAMTTQPQATTAQSQIMMS